MLQAASIVLITAAAQVRKGQLNKEADELRDENATLNKRLGQLQKAAEQGVQVWRKNY